MTFGQSSNNQNNEDLERNYQKTIANHSGSTYCVSPQVQNKRSRTSNVHFDNDGAIVVDNNTVPETQEEPTWFPMTQDESHYLEVDDEEEEVPATENQDHDQGFSFLIEASKL